MRIQVPLLVSMLMVPTAGWAQAGRPPAPVVARRIPSQEATLGWSRGAVEVDPGPDAAAHAAQPGEVLARGARVRVPEGGAAEITFANGAVVELAERTQMMMFASPTPPAPNQPPSVTTTLLRGVMRIRVAPSVGARPPALVPIATASTTVWVGRADGIVAADLGGHITRIAAHSGRIRVRANTREYILRAGSGTTEELAHPPVPYRQLLPQPTWLTTPPARVISGGEPIEVSATYGVRAPAVVSQWRVQVARDEAFHDVLANDRVPAARTRWDSPALAPGAYYARVIAIDADRFESPASTPVRVFVAAPRVVPGTMGTDTVPGRVASVDVPEGFRCGLDGAPPAHVDRPIPLVPGREHALFCLSDAQGFDLRGITVTAAQAGPLSHDVTMRGVSYGESTVGLRLRDAEGHGVPYANITVATDQGVRLDPLREGSERGVYTASVHWPQGVGRARFRFTINNAITFEQDLTQGD